MIILIIKHYFPESFRLTPYTTPIPNKLYEENWMGAYFKGEKIGYSYRKITELKNGYKISEKLKVRLKVMGKGKDIETITDAETDKLFRLSSFEFALKSDMTMDIKGKMEGKNLYVSIDTGGLKIRKTIFLKEPPCLSLSVVPNILRKGLNPGTKINIPVIDPTTLSQEHMEIEVVGKDSIMYMGKRHDAYKVRGMFKGAETLLWLTDKGEMLREESPMGFSLMKETKADAIQPGKPSIDLIVQVAVPFNIRLPPNTDYLKIKISGVDLKGLELDGGRQTLRGNILEIKKESLELTVENNPPESPRTPLWKRGAEGDFKGGKGGLLDEYLKDTIFIQSKDPSIISLAKDIVGDEKDVLKMTKLIYGWVYKNIKKVPIISLPISTEVLRTGQGDCNEHTTLFTALARARGIPTRIAVGLTYRDGFFYYHAWPEVYLSKWVAVDPTLGQFPADASHIRLLTGDIDRQLQLLTIIGKLRLEGIEYR